MRPRQVRDPVRGVGGAGVPVAVEVLVRGLKLNCGAVRWRGHAVLVCICAVLSSA